MKDKDYLHSPFSESFTKHDTFYEIDKYGFRNSHDLSSSSFLALGCSDTFGIGTDKENTWVNLVSEYIKSPINNLSIPGGSMKSCYRLLKGFLQLGFKSTKVFLLRPNVYRSEIFLNFPERRTYEIIGPNFHLNHNGPEQSKNFLKEYFDYVASDDTNSELEYSAYLDGIKFLCYKNNISLYSFLNPAFDKNPEVIKAMKDNKFHKDKAKDNHHYGNPYQKYIANKFIDLIKLDM